MTATILLVLKLSVVTLILAIGLGSTPADLTYLWRRPVQLLRSLVAMYVAVPVAALALVKTLPLPVAVKTAVLVLAISAGAPLLPRKLMKLGREGYVFSLVVTSSLLAVVAVPAWLVVLGPLFGRETTVEPRAVALVIAKAFLAPLVLGMLLRWPLRRVAERLSEWILSAAGAVLALAGVALLALHGRLLAEAGWIPLLSLVGMTAVAMAIGHAMGGPDRDDRTALAVSCATRHVGIAMLAASTVPGPRTAAFVLAYALASAAVSIPYLRWRGRAAAFDSARAK
jgi:BASS family bile acid:Na+ symporter